MSKEKKKKKGISKGRWIFIFWCVYVLGLACIALIFALASWGSFGKMPSFEQLENPQTDLATEVISSDGQTIGKYYLQNRTPVTFDELSPHSVNALVAVEDIRYYQHSGIDFRGTLRAIAYLGTNGGASTITQQLAKQLFHGEGSRNPVKRIIQKIKEWIIAVRLERNYTKKEILAMYYNIYDFTNNAVGIRSASKIYFGKKPSELNIDQAAVLAGMFKNSALYNPRHNPVGVTNRRNVVLHQMAKAGYITTQEKDSLQQVKLTLDYHPESHISGLATYFRGYLRQFLKKWARNNPKPDGSYYNIYTSGLKVYTTIDSRMQRAAEEAVHAHMADLQKVFDRQNKHNKTAPFRGITQKQIDRIIRRAIHNSRRWKLGKLEGLAKDSILASFHKKHKMRVFAWNDQHHIDTVMTPLDSIYYYKKFLNAGLLSTVPQTGEIKAWVGGIDYKYFKYDHVRQGRRQVGSAFKPYVYATAIDQLHYSPCKKFPNSIYTIPKGRYGLTEDWSPKNAGGAKEYGGMVNLKVALAKSLNTIAARLIDKTGPQPVIDLLGKLGVDTAAIPPVPAIALGTVDMSVNEMVSAYSTFANQGIYVKPVMIREITDKNGTILYQNQPVTRDVMSKESAYVTINLMEGVTQDGTGTRLRTTWGVNSPLYKKVMTGYPYDFHNPIAGKTGTTQNQSDGWFMGIVPNLCTGVWVGGADRSIHFRSLAYGQGATMALPIWGFYMKKLYANDSLHISKDAFKRPKNLSIPVNCDSIEESHGNDPSKDTLKHLQLN